MGGDAYIRQRTIVIGHSSQVIIWTNAISQLDHKEQIATTNTLIQENVFENVVCIFVCILFRSQCFKQSNKFVQDAARIYKQALTHLVLCYVIITNGII